MAQQKRDGLAIYVVDAPARFVERLRIALPDADLVMARPGIPVPSSETDDLAIVYAHSSLDWGRVVSLAALTRTIVITERPDQGEALVALESGADGYLDVGIEADPLRSALLGVLRGELAYSREILGLSLNIPRAGSPSPNAITPRQQEILGLIADGATDKEIARAMGMRTATVQKSVGRMLRRLGVRNRAAAVAVHLLPNAFDKRTR